MAARGAALTPESWERVKALFLEALERPEGERKAFLAERARSEPELAAAARRLLESGVHPRSFIEPPDLSALFGEAPEPTGSLVGQSLGEFLLSEEIGRGGMGVVYRGLQESLGRSVAVKVLNQAGGCSHKTLQRFRREALAASRLRHPNIVSVLSFGEREGVPYYAMPFIEGVSLREVLDARAEGRSTRPLPVAFDPLDLRRGARLLETVLSALQYSHEQGVIHRDVKPHNILIDRSGAPHLVDFGLARCAELDGMTRSGEILGTPHYMSPEQARSLGNRIDHRTDVFSAGAVFYELLTARLPFQGQSAQEVLFHISHSEPVAPRALDRSIPRALAIICMKALEKEPDQRYASAGDFAQDLRAFCEQRAIAARAPSRFTRTRRFARRKPGISFALAILTLLGAWLLLRTHDARVAAAAARAHLRVELPGGTPGATVLLLPLGPEPGSQGEPLLREEIEASAGEFSADPGLYRVIVRRSGELLGEFHRELRAGEPVEIAIREDAPHRSEQGMALVPSGVHRLSVVTGAGPDGSAAIHEAPVPYGSFWIDRWTVTNGEYEEFLLSTGRPAPTPWPAGPSREWEDLPRSDWYELPVTAVSWEDARDYAEWVGKRLPTLVEWEVAMSGGDRPWLTADGFEESVSQLNLDREPYSRYGDDPISTFGAYLLHVCPSRSGPACGPFGMYHPYGNVSQWVETVRVEPAEAGREGASLGRWVKGGAWHLSSEWLSDGAHSLSILVRASDRSADIGFRCARSAGR